MVRIATLADLETACRLMAESMNSEGQDKPLRKEWAKGLMLEMGQLITSSGVFLSFEDGLATGIVVCVVPPQLVFEPFGLVSSLYVVPDFRGGKTALELIRVARNYFRINGVKRAYTELRGKNADRKYYERLGVQIVAQSAYFEV